jgi:hypothetical protein
LDTLVTVKTFSYPNEVGIIRGRLESEGIRCFVQDELTTQVNHFYSNAIGGIKLQVKESDVEQALEILKEGGYLPNAEPKASRFYITLDRLTSKIPFLKKYNLELRIIFIAPILVSLVVFGIYFAALPSTFERLVEGGWCVNYITYKGENYEPNTQANLRLEVSGYDYCDESIDFRENGILTLPGFNTFSVSGEWALTDDVLTIIELDTLKHVFQGDYAVDLDNEDLTLQSATTIIHCYQTKRW